MKKLTNEEMLNLVTEVMNDLYPSFNEEDETQKLLAECILNVVGNFMLAYQEKVGE